ncbi:MAG: secondary thiamine-phosphate synthase enzyme YjbQ [Candidatus Norongarragalinales archaeon]
MGEFKEIGERGESTVKEFKVSSSKQIQAIDVTSEVEAIVRREKWRDGVLFVFVPHCTAALIVNEFEPNIAADYEKYFSELRKQCWSHDEIDDNAAAHLGSAIAGSERFFFVKNGELVLGTWQRVILMELDGPRDRCVLLEFVEK